MYDETHELEHLTCTANYAIAEYDQPEVTVVEDQVKRRSDGELVARRVASCNATVMHSGSRPRMCDVRPHDFQARAHG